MFPLLVRYGLISLAIALAIYPFAPSAPSYLNPADFADSSPPVKVALLRQKTDKLDAGVFIAARGDANADVRLMAVMISPVRGKREAESLIVALKDPHAGVRREAARKLGYAGSSSTRALLEALEDSDPLVRVGAALAFGDFDRKMGPDRPRSDLAQALPLLETAVKDEDASVRQSAISTLERLRRYMDSGRKHHEGP